MSSLRLNRFFQSTELSVVGGLRSGDIILHLDKFYDTETQTYFEKRIKWIVQYTPVYFKRSGNWVIRSTRRPQNPLSNGSDDRTEYLYVNTLCLYKYYFPMSAANISQKLKADDQLQSLLETLDESDF